MDQIEVLTIFHQIMKIWPKRNIRKTSRYLRKLRGVLTEDFSDADLFNAVREVVDEKVVFEQAGEVVVEFLDGTDGWPTRARFLRGSDSVWRLESLKHLCAICFGEGVNPPTDPNRCSICDGRGWQ